MIRFHVLGGPVLLRGDVPVTGRAAYRRRIAVLAILAAARGRPVGRERIVGLLWPDQTSDGARHALSEALYVLRRELAEDVVTAVGDEVALNAERVGTDLDDFERGLEEGRAEDAVRHYGGPFLDGFYVQGADEFERWAEEQRDRLSRACAKALEGIAEGAEREGDPLRAADAWRRLAAMDPYSSRVALRLVRALSAGGEHAAALRQAAAHADVLREELGVGPDPELTAFVERLRAESVPLPPSSISLPARPASPDGGPRYPLPADADPPASPESKALASPDSVPPSGVSRETAPVVASARPSGRWRRWAAAGGALLAASTAAVVLGRRPEAPPAAPELDPRRIAVLYFDDYSRGGELEYLANGLTEMLIHELSQVEALDVVSRNGVKPYRAGTVPLDSVAARLRAGSLVEGSVQGGGDSVRVTVQLIDANTQSHLESRVIVRPMGDVLAVESALAEEVSGFLRRRLGREVRLRRAEAETRSARARELALRAEQLRADAVGMAAQRHRLDRRAVLRLLDRADSMAAAAEAADPRWARPTLLRGEVALARAQHGSTEEAAAFVAAAAAAADRVLAREPRHARALALRGLAGWRAVLGATDTAGKGARLEAAERDFRAAVEADSSLAGAWATLAQVLRLRGSFAEANLAAARALAEDAYLDEAPDILERLFYAAMADGDHAEAGRVCRRAHLQFPADWRYVQCGLTLLREDPAAAPDPDAAWAMVAELDRVDPPSRAQAAGRAYQVLYRRVSVAAVLARAGRPDSARAVLARVRAAAAGDEEMRVNLYFDEAYVRVLLGERDEARRLLRAYLAARPTFADYIRRDAAFRGLFDAPAPR